MGFFDRLGKVATGVGGAIQSPFGLVKDLAVGAFTDDDEFDGFVGTVYGSVTKRGGQLFGNVLGPEEGLGAAIGGLPGAVRRPAKAVLDPIFTGLETAGREAIREPLTAALTAGSLMSAGKGFDLGRGYEIAQTRSLGQAFALAILTEDITDEAEVAEAMGTDWYQTLSGTMDAVARIFLEPDALLSGGLSAARRAGTASRLTQGLTRVPGAAGLVEKGVFGRTIRTKKDVEAALAHPALGVINEQIDVIKREAGIGAPLVPPVEAVAAAVPWPGRTNRATQMAQELYDELGHEATADLLHTAHGVKPESIVDALRNTIASGKVEVGGKEVPRFRQLTDQLDVEDPKRITPGAAIGAPTAPRPLAQLPEAEHRTRDLGDYTNVMFRETSRKGLISSLGRGPGAGGTPSVHMASTENLALGQGANKGLMVQFDVEGVQGHLSRKKPSWQFAYKQGEAEFLASASGEELLGRIRRIDVRDPDIDANDLAGQLGGDFVKVDNPDGTASIVRRDAAPAVAPPGVEPSAAAVPTVPLAKDPAAVDRAAARIRDLAFHDHSDGAFISRVLAESDDLPTAWGALMGDQPSIDRLFAQKADVAGEISRLQGDQARLNQAKRLVGSFNGPGQLPLELSDDLKAVERSQLDVEIDARYDVEARLRHHEQANRMVREIPRISGSSERRSRMIRSEFFQQSPWAAPLRQAINMRPRNMVDLHDATGDIEVARMLRKARVAIEVQDEIRGRYMAAPDPGIRNTVLEEAQAESIRAIAQRHGITDPDAIDAAIASANNLQIQARDEILKSRAYDGAGRSRIRRTDEKTGVTHDINLPLAVTQEFNTFIMPNLDRVDDALAELADKSKRFNIPMASMLDGTIKGSTELLDKFQGIWKPSVLFRAGWPIRVVGEEQLRIMSMIGAMMTVGRTTRSAGRFGLDLGHDAIIHAQQAFNHLPKSERILRDPDRAARRGVRLGTLRYRGVEYESAYGTNETFKAQYRAQVSARPTMEAMTTNHDVTRGKLRAEVMGEWQTLEPTNPAWGGAWEHAVNHQMAGDTVWRQFVEGKSLDEVRDFIDTTTEGRAYLRRLPHWKSQVDDWLEFMEQTVNDYLPTDELRVAALEGKARADDIVKAVPDAAGRPNVHGAALADVSGKTKAAEWIGTNIRDRGMRWLGTIPTDVLSRNNYFDFLYTNEMNRQIDLILDQGGELNTTLIPQLEGNSRNYALKESKKLLYEMGTDSELAHTLRFIAPFFSAWQEVLTRWTGIAVENPAFVFRMQEVWRSPEKAGIVTDEDGNTINGDGTATSPLGEPVEPGKDRFVNMRLLAGDNVLGKVLFNDLTKHIPGAKLAENAKFNKKSFNTILQGAPGVGPIVQIPLNEIAKGRPELEDSLKWALPFGASQSTMDMLLPATARRIKTKAGGEEDRIYQNQLLRIYWDMQVDFNLGKRTEKPTYAEAKKKTDNFYNVRTVASFVSPAAPSFQSPYQAYIDRYRALKEKDPETADEIFLRDEGPEFFPLTQSLSKTMDGIPPTLEGAAARQKYVDLIEKHPELGGLIVGAEGAGEFSSAVYQSQLQKPVAPGAEDRQRKAFSFEEAEAKPNERLGWIEFSKAMDLIDAERMNRGLPNLQVKQAQDLRDLKDRVITGLEKKYPEWGVEFNITDRGRWERKIAGMREIAADERLAGRDEIRVLGEYLEARDVITDELAARKAAGGPSTLNAAGNMDLDGLWKRITAQLTDGNTAFSQLFYRYLERDPLDIEET